MYTSCIALYNERHRNGNALYCGRLCNQFLWTALSSLRTLCEGTVSTLAGIYIEVQSTHVNTFVGVAGVNIGTAAWFVPADSGKMVGNCDTYVACLKYCQKKKSGVVKWEELVDQIIGTPLPIHFRKKMLNQVPLDLQCENAEVLHLVKPSYHYKHHLPRRSARGIPPQDSFHKFSIFRRRSP